MNIAHINCNYMDSWLHQNMIDTLETMGIKNKVFVPLYKLYGYDVFPKDYVTAKVCFNKFDRLFFHYKQRKIISAFIDTIDFSNVDCIHAYTVFTDGNAARYVSMKTGIPYVVAVRNTDVNTFFKYMIHLRAIGVKVLKDAKAVFFLSESYRQLVISKYIPKKYREIILNKSYVIPNGIDNFWHLNIFRDRDYKSAEFRINQKCLRLVYAGSIDQNKNLSRTCEAISILKSKGWKVDYTAIGKINDKRYFKSIKDKLIYKEAKPKEELISYYRNADIFIMPSYKETFGLVYAEAMSQGLPVIYSHGQGFDKQFPEGMVGYDVNANSSDSIVKAIEKILTNYKEISFSSIENVKKFEWTSICKKYIEIYKCTQ